MYCKIWGSFFRFDSKLDKSLKPLVSAAKFSCRFCVATHTQVAFENNYPEGNASQSHWHFLATLRRVHFDPNLDISAHEQTILRILSGPSHYCMLRFEHDLF